MKTSQYGVHRNHCCVLHGCKYNDVDCPVVNRLIDQEYICEDCEAHGIKNVDSLKKILSTIIYNDDITQNQFYQLQVIANAFNDIYFKAVETSDALGYFNAALLGRQVVDYLCKHGIIKDREK